MEPAGHRSEVDPLQVELQEQERGPRPPEAEIVIAELLDGPPPTGIRPSAESQWAPRPEADFFVDDLLVQRSDSPASRSEGGAGPGQEAPPAGEDDGKGGGDLAGVIRPRQPSDQARIAADRARRRRSRRGGGRGNPPGSG